MSDLTNIWMQELAPQHTDAFWLGRLSMALAVSIREKDANRGREALEDYLSSPVSYPGTVEMIRKELQR